MPQKFRALILIAIVSMSVFPAPQSADGAPAFAARAHPYLLFDQGDLPELVADANNSSHERSRILNALRDEVDAAGSSIKHSGLTATALVYRITGQKSYGELVRQELLELAGQDEWQEGGERGLRMAERLIYYALAFDWTYDYLQTKSGFGTIRDKLAHETFKMYEAASGSYNSTWLNFWRHSYTGHLMRDVSSMLLGAMALKYEGDQLSSFSQSDVNTWIAFGTNEFVKAMAAIDRTTDGSWFSGNMYEETRIGVYPQILYALRRVEGVDLLSNSTWFQATPRYWIYNMIPENPRYRITNYGDNGGLWYRKNGILAGLRLAAREYRDPYAQWAADRNVAVHGRDVELAGIDSANAIALEFIYYDDSVAARSPQGDWPVSWHATELEAAFMRTGWEGNGTYAALKTGAYGGHGLFELAKANYVWTESKARWDNAGYAVGGSQGIYPQDIKFNIGHSHPDNNGFYIYANGVYLAPEASGTTNSNKHAWAGFTSSHNTITVDGRGQVGDGPKKLHPQYGPDREDFFRSDGSIPVFAPTANFDFAMGDATRTYPRALELTEFQRHFFFLKPDYFVIFDTLNASSPKAYDWYVHIPDQPTFEGRWVKGDADGGNLLGVYVVSPSTYDRETGVRASDTTALNFADSDRELFYVRLGVTGAREMRFITVLLPTTDGEWANRPQIEKIAETNRSAGVRVIHSDGSIDAILSGYHANGLTSIGSFAMDGLAGAVRRNSAGNLISIYLVQGSQLVENNATLLTLSESVDAFEATYNNGTIEVTGENIPGFTLYAPGTSRLKVNGSTVSFSTQGGFISYGGGASIPTFGDVDFSHPMHDEIEALYQAGYTIGCQAEPLLYCPERVMNRAESAVFVARGVHGANSVPSQPTSQIFADLPLDSWAAKWATGLYDDGYTAGCAAAPLVFCPWQGHTRTEGTVFYLRMLNGPNYTPPQPTGMFADVVLEFWGADWIEAAYNAGLIPACGENPLRFCPDEPLTRAMAAYMMVQAKGLSMP